MPKVNKQANTALWQQARKTLKPLILSRGVVETADAMDVSHGCVGSFVNGRGGMTATTLDKMLDLFDLDMEIRFAPRKEA